MNETPDAEALEKLKKQFRVLIREALLPVIISSKGYSSLRLLLNLVGKEVALGMSHTDRGNYTVRLFKPDGSLSRTSSTYEECIKLNACIRESELEVELNIYEGDMHDGYPTSLRYTFKSGKCELDIDRLLRESKIVRTAISNEFNNLVLRIRTQELEDAEQKELARIERTLLTKE
jgi:hypothetical protein